jgi:uncharacterized protein (DUF2235 family)
MAARSVVICLDGTRNEPERGLSNVARLYDVVLKSPDQAVYYDPGVGTMGARGAVTRVGKALTRTAGLVMGHGVRDNIAEAYRFLADTYERGDRIYVFGFSRGAYTARALVGMLRTVGLLRPGTGNLDPYALKLYTQSGKEGATAEDEKEFWAERSRFNDAFGNPEFPSRFAPQVAFLGIWDTVKSIGWLNWRARYQQARWPFTRNVSNVACGRHALAIDERRRYYAAYRFDSEEVAKGDRLREAWFAGVHSDVGGTFVDDHRLADISLAWMVGEAHAKGLLIDDARYKRTIGIPFGTALPDDYCLGSIHHNGLPWAVMGAGWKSRRPIAVGDEIHPSVERRIELTRDDPDPYRIR